MPVRFDRITVGSSLRYRMSITSNIWTMAQQGIVIRNMPNPGSEAYRARQARLKAKGKLTDNEAAEADSADGSSGAQGTGQRQQPMSSKRAKKKPTNPNDKNK